MANTGKHIPSRRPATDLVASAPDGTIGDERFSPRVEALRKLVAEGQYHVSPRYLAYRIFRAAGLRPE